MLCASAIRLKVPVQASSFNPSSTSLKERSRDEWQVDCFIRCGPFCQNHKCACLPPLPQAASRYYMYKSTVNMPRRCGCAALNYMRQTVKLSSQSPFISEVVVCVSFPSPRKVNPSLLRWLWPSCWHSCMTASCRRATSPSTWLSNLAPRSSLTLAFPRQTPSRGYALRKVPNSKTQHYFRRNSHMLERYYSPQKVSLFLDTG